MKRKLITIMLLLCPINVFAYSNKLIIGGEPIGIEIHSKGVYIVDFYKNNHTSPEKEGLQKGDQIIKVNNKTINSINDLNEIIKKEGNYQIEVLRKNEVKKYILEAYKENNIIKTGLFIKDEIDGIGTLSYIDPETKIFASLGHEILESSSNELFDIKNGMIYPVEISNIKKSENGSIGELHATFHDEVIGTIEKNEENGIYGKFIKEADTNNTIEIADSKEIKKEEATIILNLNNQKKEYKIDIISINDSDPVKNILFEIKDQELLQKTGGVVQGMSGAPILQDNKIIGVVNYVVISDSKKGYGIFIKRMLEEGDKLLNS